VRSLIRIAIGWEKACWGGDNILYNGSGGDCESAAVFLLPKRRGAPVPVWERWRRALRLPKVKMRAKTPEDLKWPQKVRQSSS